MTDAARTALEPWLLEVLACPACRSPLREHAGPESAELLCTGCGRAYPVRDGIPVLLVDEARPTEPLVGGADGGATGGAASSAASTSASDASSGPAASADPAPADDRSGSAG